MVRSRLVNSTIFAIILAIPLYLTWITFSNIYLIWLTYLLWFGVTLGVFTFVIYFTTYLRSKRYPMQGSFPLTTVRRYRIAAFVTAYNENPRTVESTLIATKAAISHYGYGDAFLLDDSTKSDIAAELNEFCTKNGIYYRHRTNRRGFKAGAVNNALLSIANDYDLVTIFDADQRPSADFYDYVAIHFDKRSVALVQVPQYYSERASSIANGAFFQQIPFLRIIMRGRNTKSAFSLGSGTTFRIKALKEVNYLKENTVTEDIATSVMLHARGWTSTYVDFPGIWYGEPPQDVGSYLKQQGRWSLGGFQLLPDLFREKLTISSFLDYISGASYWLLKGPITVAYLCAPIIFILFGLSFMNINFIDYFMIIIPYISVSMISFIYIIRRESEYGMKGYLLHQTVEYLEFPTATVSFLKWLFRRKFTFVVTPKGGTERGKKKHRRDKFTLLPHYITFLGLTIALCIGALRLFTGNYISPYPMIVNLIWVVYFMPFAISGLLVSLSSRKEKGTSALIVPI